MLLKIVLGLLLALIALVVATLVRSGAPLTAPPGLFARLGTYLTENVAETAPEPRFPELRERQYRVPPEPILRYLAAAARALDWEVADEDPRNHRLHAVVTTPLLHFQDDLRVQIRLAPGGGSRLSVRSASRVGKADFGANTAHIVAFFEELERQLPPQAR
jgi:hypothetical protein